MARCTVGGQVLRSIDALAALPLAHSIVGPVIAAIEERQFIVLPPVVENLRQCVRPVEIAPQIVILKRIAFCDSFKDFHWIRFLGVLFFLPLRRNPVGIQLHTPIGIAIAISEELGSVIVSFTGILRPVVEHPFLPAPGTFPDDHRTGRSRQGPACKVLRYSTAVRNHIHSRYRYRGYSAPAAEHAGTKEYQS